MIIQEKMFPYEMQNLFGFLSVTHVTFHCGFELRGVFGEVKVNVDDRSHHPVQHAPYLFKASLMYPSSHLKCCMEPHHWQKPD